MLITREKSKNVVTNMVTIGEIFLVETEGNNVYNERRGANERHGCDVLTFLAYQLTTGQKKRLIL